MASRSSVVSVPILLGDTQRSLRTVPTTYYGYTLYNNGATNGVVRIFDNATGSTGTNLDIVFIPAFQTVNAYYPVEDSIGGLMAQNGIWFFASVATIEGSIRLD